MGIRFFDMFAGIGGFRSGLTRVGGFDCVGYCEIDPFARQAYEALYDTKGELYFDDARTIDPSALPDLDLICGGFPCQSFSIAGKRGGFDDARGTLFFEIARIAAVKRPAYLLLENVPGLLSHDGGRTFATILSALSELGYDVTWQVLNSKDFGVPQSRKRVFIVGFLRERCVGQVLCFTRTNEKNPIQIAAGPQGSRIYSAEGTSITLTSNAGGFAGKTGLYELTLLIKSCTKKGYHLAYPGDSINFSYPNNDLHRGRVGENTAHTLTTSPTQGIFFIDLNVDPEITELARCITARQDAGVGKRPRERSGVFVEIPFIEDDSNDDEIFSVLFQDTNGNYHIGYVRRLMPLECWRLQGFTDEQFNKVAALGFSDGKLYKMAGNAVTVPVISALGEFIKNNYTKNKEVILP